MGRSRGRQKEKKVNSVFKVASRRALKAKKHAKVVARNLKKINFHVRENVDASNQQLDNIRELLVTGQNMETPDEDIEQHSEEEQSTAGNIEDALNSLQNL